MKLRNILAMLMVLIIIPLTAYGLELERIKTYFLDGDYKSAIMEGEKLMAQAEGPADLDELYYILGVSYLKDGNYLRASDIFEIILNELKDSSFKFEARLGLGDAYYLMGNYPKAEAHYREIIDKNRDSRMLGMVYYRLGQCGYKIGNIDKAKQYMELANADSAAGNIELGSSELCPPVANYYSVQVGAFTKNNNAVRMMEKLVLKGFSAYLETNDAAGIVTYRVKVGKFSLRREAEETVDKLAQDGYPARVYP